MKCVLHDGAGSVLFVRHAYGRRELWEVPGGGAHRDEPAIRAARREAREELGLDITEWDERGTVTGTWQGTRLALDCVAATWPRGARLDPDPVEIGGLAWFTLADPPRPLGPVSAAVLPLLAGL